MKYGCAEIRVASFDGMTGRLKLSMRDRCERVGVIRLNQANQGPG